MVGHPGLVAPYELPQLPVTLDLAGSGIVNDDPPGPHVLQEFGIAFFECLEILSDRISVPSSTPVLPSELHRTDEVRKPRHFDLRPPATTPRYPPPDASSRPHRQGLTWAGAWSSVTTEGRRRRRHDSTHASKR